MTTVSWLSGVNGNWNINPTDWNTGSPPAAGDDAVISVSGTYTVSITSQINPVATITLGATGATLAIVDPGVTQSVTGTVSNSGTLSLDTAGSSVGSLLSVGGG